MKLIKFHAEWCQPCKNLAKTLETLGVKPDGNYNVEEYPDLAMQFDIMKIPVLVVQDDEGKEVARLQEGSDGVKVKGFLKEHGFI